MATLIDLINSTEKFKPNLFAHANSVEVQQTKITRARGVRTVHFSCVTQDKGDPKRAHTKNQRRITHIMFVADRGVDVKNYAPSISKDKVLVRSSSPWYRYAFQYNNKKIKAQYGSIKPFEVLGTGRPINPMNYPGLDKHLIALVRALKSNKLIRG